METPFEEKMKIMEDEEFQEHEELKQRLKKTLYYGKIKTMDRPSLAMTELAVDYLQELVPRELGKIDMYWAASISSDVSVTPCALMLALMYVKRLKHNNSQYLSQVSSSDLFLISVLVASKYLYDEGESDDVSNTQWSCLTKIDVEDINENESAFLHAMDWRIFVRPDEFWSFVHSFEEKVAWKMGLQRNSFTYTDLSVITSLGPICHILYDLLLQACGAVIVCSVAYVGCVLTLYVSNLATAVVFSQAFVPLLPVISAVPRCLPSVAPASRNASPSHCLSPSKRVHDCGVHRLSAPRPKNEEPIANTIFPRDLSHICDPLRTSWNPRTCVHASTCLTIALMQELVMSSCGLASDLVSKSVSFATDVSQSLIVPSRFSVSSVNPWHTNNPENAIGSSAYFSCESSSHHASNRSYENKRPTSIEGFDQPKLCGDKVNRSSESQFDEVMSPTHNHSSPMSNLMQSHQLVELLGQ